MTDPDDNTRMDRAWNAFLAEEESHFNLDTTTKLWMQIAFFKGIGVGTDLTSTVATKAIDDFIQTREKSNDQA